MNPLNPLITTKMVKTSLNWGCMNLAFTLRAELDTKKLPLLKCFCV